MRAVTFADLPRAIQIQLAAIGPLLFGLVCGFLLEIDAAAYWAASALSAGGGLAGGSEHAAIRPAALRGTVAGTCFGLGVVIANAASDRHALAPLPSPTAALILITATAGGGLAAAGARLASRH
jgi:hypothetical protein